MSKRKDRKWDRPLDYSDDYSAESDAHVEQRGLDRIPASDDRDAADRAPDRGTRFAKPSDAWAFINPLVRLAIEEETRPRLLWGGAIERHPQGWDGLYEDLYGDFEREVTLRLIEDGFEEPSPPDPREPRCQGYVNGCTCPRCRDRAKGGLMYGPIASVVARELERFNAPPPDRRGGARQRRRHEAGRVRLEEEELLRYDFTYRSDGTQGRGKAGDDRGAIEAFLCCEIHEMNGRLWIRPDRLVREIADYGPATSRGRKSDDAQRLRADLAARVDQLVADGANNRAIAAVLDIKEHSIKRLREWRR